LPVSRTWSDLDLDFIPNPNTGDIGIKKNENAIVRSLRYLMQTNHYERPFHPEIGGNISKFLFDPISLATTLRIKQAIKETINNWEPRVKINEIIVRTIDSPMDAVVDSVIGRPQENGYQIAIRFYIVSEEVERQTIFFLERNR
jgi:phage baseplate assembly protein W